MIIKPTFQSWQCAGQRIFLRADLNVPLVKGTLLSDRRLQGIKPTIDYLLEKGAQIILATHLGRPTSPDAALSTQQLIPWFKQQGYTIHFAATATAVKTMPVQSNIILLENLRFFPGEKNKSSAFAHELAALAPWYVNDAFGTLHRDDTSVALLAEQYEPSHRSVGFLVEKELTILHHLLHNPVHPVTFILGGGKVADKLPLIKNLCSFADTIVVVPAIVFTFLKAMGHAVGASLIDNDAIAHIPSIMKEVKSTKTSLIFPVDYQIAKHDVNGALSYVNAHQIPNDTVGISIGPKSIEQLQQIIKNSRTVFYNGAMGFSERPETLQGMQAILRAMSQCTATTIVAGGDSIAIVDQLGLTGITHCITGGGATLTYLSNQPLPGLQPFLKNWTKTN